MMKKWYILERHNPQLGIYYVGEGQMTRKDAKARERSIYGHNYMHGYDTEDAYKAELKRLRESGQKVS